MLVYLVCLLKVVLVYDPNFCRRKLGLVKFMRIALDINTLPCSGLYPFSVKYCTCIIFMHENSFKLKIQCTLSVLFSKNYTSFRAQQEGNFLLQYPNWEHYLF